MTFRLHNRRKRYPVMTESAWMRAVGFFSMWAMVVGLGTALIVDGMVWAAFAGTGPAWAYLFACHYLDWSKGL